MWEFITLTITSILAIIGASLNTEKDDKGEKKNNPEETKWRRLDSDYFINLSLTGSSGSTS